MPRNRLTGPLRSPPERSARPRRAAHVLALSLCGVANPAAWVPIAHGAEDVAGLIVALDADDDGRLTSHEVRATPLAARFTEFDTNADGALDRRELRARGIGTLSGSSFAP